MSIPVFGGSWGEWFCCTLPKGGPLGFNDFSSSFLFRDT